MLTVGLFLLFVAAGALGFWYFYKVHTDLKQQLHEVTQEAENAKKNITSLQKEFKKLQKFLNSSRKEIFDGLRANRMLITKETVKELITDLENEGIFKKTSNRQSKDIIIIQEVVQHTHDYKDAVDAEDMTVILDEARELVKTTGIASTNFLESKLRISHDDAEDILFRLEEEGIVGPADGSSHRAVFVRD